MHYRFFLSFHINWYRYLAALSKARGRDITSVITQSISSCEGRTNGIWWSSTSSTRRVSASASARCPTLCGTRTRRSVLRQRRPSTGPYWAPSWAPASASSAQPSTTGRTHRLYSSLFDRLTFGIRQTYVPE